MTFSSSLPMCGMLDIGRGVTTLGMGTFFCIHWGDSCHLKISGHYTTVNKLITYCAQPRCDNDSSILYKFDVNN